MMILALESSATACSAALCRDGELMAQSYQNSGLTHSRTLLPMVDAMLNHCGMALSQVDVIAVATGPGSFTGLRIGVATAKGLAWPEDKDCAPCSTLESMAWPLAHLEGKVIVCAMDARRNQVYNALFLAQGEELKRLTPDRAISLKDLGEELKKYENSKIVVGDGARLCYNTMTELEIGLELAPLHLRMQSAWGVARAAEKLAARGALVKGRDLVPVYHRLSQAERERLEREKTQMKGISQMLDNKVHILDHPLLQHKLSILRDEKTGVKEFREIVSEIAALECYEATRDLPLEEVVIKTPIATGTFKHLTGKKLAIVPILRAGLGMVDGILDLIPSAKVGHIGLYRDPETHAPVEYYCKMPADIAERDVIILDPMLATGGSASAAITFLKGYGCKHIKLMNILAAPEGIACIQKDHPDVDIYVAAVDEKLNEHAYIVPGLGDAGDRIFGTK